MSATASWLAAPPADAAIEISPEAVAAAAVSFRGSAPAVQSFAVQPLPAGALAASLTAANVLNRAAVAGALREALDALGTRPRRVALLLPDVTARVSLVRFEQMPARSDDLEQLVRWQLRKSAPFALEEAVLTCAPAGRAPDGAHELVAVLARRSVVREYETLCEEAGLEPGLVDLSTFGLLNLLLASAPPSGDWLVVHVRPEYLSLAIMRGTDVIFFRNVPGSDGETLVDAAHQTAMYYQDRLSGSRFGQVLLCGAGLGAEAIGGARRSLEERLGTPVAPIDVTRVVPLRDRLAPTPELTARLAPLVGTLLRMQVEVRA